MLVDFKNIEDVEDFSPLDDGQYLCKLIRVEEGSTQSGDEMWKLRFEVIHGEYQGRFIFDNLVFSLAAMKRVKLICSCLGLNVSKDIELKPDLLKDRHCYVSVVTEEYEDNQGKVKRRNTVPFAGYAVADAVSMQTAQTSKGNDENLPF